MKIIKKYFFIPAIALSICILTSVDRSDAQEKAIVAVPLKMHEANSTLGILTSRIIFLADQLLNNKAITIDKPIIITSFQNLDNLTETDKIGRLIAETLIHEMHIRNFKVIDYRLQDNLQISEQGEIVLSRNPKNLKNEVRAGYILTGTYSTLKQGILVNARLIDVETSMVISTGVIILPDFFPKTPKIRIVGGN